MLDFLRKLFEFKKKDLTVILLNDEEPENSNSFEFRPEQLFRLFYLSLGIIAVILIFFVMFTPLGSLVYDRQDEQVRESVIEIAQKISSLQDSLHARDQQLRDLQQVLVSGKDTTFQTSADFQSSLFSDEELQNGEPGTSSSEQDYETVSRNEIIFSGILKNAPSFPALFPVEGTLTRGFSQETGHLGIDIATHNQATFHAIADGTVISQDWTLNYGYVLQIQHEDGIVSIYKHVSSLSTNIGDIVLKGDILGTVGNVGILSSGPHLHVEIWKNGVAQDPLTYLIKS